MEHSNFPLKEFLAELYTAFEASLRDAFLATVTSSDVSHPASFVSLFDGRCSELSERYFSLINVFVLINSEDDAHEELERFSLILKRYIQDDIQSMKKMLKTFVIRATTAVNRKAELLYMFETPRMYNLKNLGRITPRILHV